MFWDGPPRVFLAENPATFSRFTSTPLLEELEDALSRTKFAARIALSALSTDRLVEKYMQSAPLVIPHQLTGIAPDSDDDVVIGTALAADADFIVTGDLELLSVERYDSIRIVTAADALKAIAR
jgi:hypothetical protein